MGVGLSAKSRGPKSHVRKLLTTLYYVIFEILLFSYMQEAKNQ